MSKLHGVLKEHSLISIRGLHLKLPPRDWSDPLIHLDDKFGTPQNLDRAVYNRYRTRLHYLSLIWDRLRADIDAHEEYIQLSMDFGNKKVSHAELIARTEELERDFRYLRLDQQDFCVHSVMLLDRLSVVAKTLLRIKVPTKSFSEHRKFFREGANIPFLPDDEYAKYVRDRTWWFVRLKDYRDDFIEHDAGPAFGGVTSGPNSAPRLIRTRLVAEDRRARRVYDNLLSLRDKYRNVFGERRTGSENSFELEEMFYRHADKLEPIDRQILIEATRVLGIDSPDLVQLADEILAFLQFIRNHFS